MDITINRWCQNYARDLAEALNNKKVLDNLRDGLPFPYTTVDAREYIDITLNAEPDSQYSWAIMADDKVIGSIGAFRQSNIHSRTAEIGYYIAEDYWGQGVGSLALKQVCDYVFNNTNIIRIFAEPFAHNIGSCRILEKAGFQLEGLLRKNAVKNGEIIDMKMYSLIKAGI